MATSRCGEADGLERDRAVAGAGTRRRRERAFDERLAAPAPLAGRHELVGVACEERSDRGRVLALTRVDVPLDDVADRGLVFRWVGRALPPSAEAEISDTTSPLPMCSWSAPSDGRDQTRNARWYQIVRAVRESGKNRRQRMTEVPQRYPASTRSRGDHPPQTILRKYGLRKDNDPRGPDTRTVPAKMAGKRRLSPTFRSEGRRARDFAHS